MNIGCMISGLERSFSIPRTFARTPTLAGCFPRCRAPGPVSPAPRVPPPAHAISASFGFVRPARPDGYWVGTLNCGRGASYLSAPRHRPFPCKASRPLMVAFACRETKPGGTMAGKRKAKSRGRAKSKRGGKKRSSARSGGSRKARGGRKAARKATRKAAPKRRKAAPRRSAPKPAAVVAAPAPAAYSTSEEE